MQIAAEKYPVYSSPLPPLSVLHINPPWRRVISRSEINSVSGKRICGFSASNWAQINALNKCSPYKGASCICSFCLMSLEVVFLGRCFLKFISYWIHRANCPSGSSDAVAKITVIFPPKQQVLRRLLLSWTPLSDIHCYLLFVSTRINVNDKSQRFPPRFLPARILRRHGHWVAYMCLRVQTCQDFSSHPYFVLLICWL